MFRQDLFRLPIFEGLSHQQLDQLTSRMELCQFNKDEGIFEQGQAARYLYILVDGAVEVRFKPYDGPPLTVTSITPGGVFGWSASLGRDIYTSSAIATQDSEAYRMSSKTFHSLCDLDPDTGAVLLDRLASVIGERMQDSHTKIINILSESMELNGDCLRRIGKE
ncbi:MAG: cyclic nucleotide-binding domain-containing protein [Chloroflexi bacterium]|nr:cyclic nucleotide-binding domain-containing protein [Anaerolineaceae bacterium]NMB90888.1 cyclic nucleotide-binding domain-containing protein [Chloroflexota bacterium]